MSTARLPAHAEPTDPPRSSPGLDVRDLEKRTRLMRIITRLIAVSDLGSREIARRAGLPMQKISDLLSGKLEHLSVDEMRLVYHSIDTSGTPTPP
ncbi:XRE family transcriptional regulator [Halomonas saccharevitans]|uniref:Predicted DNA-binding protein, contains XRE-type HTH domain n=1 Tax=Halomonas saccharevitans TaxID=416872 RepID=A0A1I6XUS7_9GAMM|nr:XRE family transcriptional regulator [Halomonas saccharevitans]SFT42275.1 Predicted DNA-binding protein, contains XRE-type HTH domain [Halomonas saccharevitans]